MLVDLTIDANNLLAWLEEELLHHVSRLALIWLQSCCETLRGKFDMLSGDVVFHLKLLTSFMEVDGLIDEPTAAKVALLCLFPVVKRHSDRTKAVVVLTELDFLEQASL